MNQEATDKILRKKILWAEIKAKEQEYKRLQSQINKIEQSKKDVSSEIEKRLAEVEKIGEWLAEREHEALMREDEK